MPGWGSFPWPGATSGYTFAQFTLDLIQRAGRLDNAAGITLLSAANSIQSMIGKKLLDRRSDILADNDLQLSIAAQGCSTPLPTGFISMAEKPRSQDIYTDWMMGTVVSYDNTLGTLVLLVNQSSGSDTIDSWNIATVPVPGGNSEIIGTSSTSLAIVAPANNATLTITAGLGLSAGTALYVIPSEVPATYSPYPNAGKRTLQPEYLGEDKEHDDPSWWSWYGLYGWTWEPPAQHPHHYKIVNTTLYIRPYAIMPVIITGKYFGLPNYLTEDGTIPWGGLFDEIFRVGVIRIIQKGIEIPDADQDFMAFLAREFDSVMSARMHLLSKTRTSHSSFM